MLTTPAARVRPLRPRTAGVGSLSLERRLAFLQESTKSLFRVRHREESVLQLPLQRETLVHRHLDSLGHRSLDEADRARRVLRIREAFRERHRLLPELLPWEYAVQEAPVERLFRREHPSGRHEVDRAALPDEAGRPIRHAPSEATRRSVDIAISRPPPTQCPSIAAMNSFGVLSSLFSVS